MKQRRIIPECWEELTPKQFKYLLRKVFILMVNPAITKEDILKDFADYLLGRNRYFIPSKRIEYLLLVNVAVDVMKWIFTESTNEVVFNYETTMNLLPAIGKLVGPQSAGYDLRFGEYRKACWMYNSYTLEHEVKYLDGLVGILYRKPSKNTRKSDFNGDYRERFNANHIGKYAKRVKRIPEPVKWGVYLWFGYFCKYLMTEPFEIEGNEVSFAPIFQSGSDPDGKQDESLGMTSVLFTLAESRTFGNITETDAETLFNIMLKLLNDDIQAKNLRKS